MFDHMNKKKRKNVRSFLSFLKISSLIRDETTNRMTYRTPVDCRIIQFNQEKCLCLCVYVENINKKSYVSKKRIR